MADGYLRLNMRGGGAQPRGKLKHYRLIAYSSNGGLSWSKTKYDDELMEPQCLASTLRYSWPEEGRSRVLFSNPADKQRRIKMTVRLSYDEGQSWPVSRIVHKGPSAYSCLNRLPDGDIGLLYEGGKDYKYEKISFARFSLDWLKDEEKSAEYKRNSK